MCTHDTLEFTTLTTPHLVSLRRYAKRLLRVSNHQAGDYVQETLLRAYSHFDRYDRSRSIRPWLMRILHNVCINELRRRTRTRQIADALCLVHASRREMAASVARLELDAPIAKALDRLPQPQRHAITLVDLMEYTYQEAAQHLDCPIGTVMSRLYRGRATLARSLRGYARRHNLQSRRAA